MLQVLIRVAQGRYRVCQVLISVSLRHPRSQGRHVQGFCRVPHVPGLGCAEIIECPRSWVEFW